MYSGKKLKKNCKKLRFFRNEGKSKAPTDYVTLKKIFHKAVGSHPLWIMLFRRQRFAIECFHGG